MKLAVIVLLTVCVCFVKSEDCPNNNVATDCTHITCGSGLVKSCVKNICTCTAFDSSCNSQTDCTGDCGRTWHCVDNQCRCGGNFFPGGGR